jgi:hypothetical protein
MIAIVIVDGTGTDTFVAPNNDQYKTDYANSHCSRIAREFSHTTYQRGPWLDGFNMRQTIDEAYVRALAFAANGACKGLCLIGHSRGGAAVIAVAHRLKEKGIEVGFMGLFDAVEMDCNFSWDVDKIPDNVQSVFHAQRQMATLSRHLWGNCGDAWANGKIGRLVLWGTHGAIGGVPPGVPPDHPRPPDELIWEAGNLIRTRVTVAQAQKASADAWTFVVTCGLRTALARLGAQPGKPGGTQPGENYPGIGQPGNGGGGGGRNGNGKGKTHIVVKGDSLSLIAGKHYGDVLLWPVIHDSNKQQIGTTPNLIQPGWKLTIPSVDGYTPGQLDAIRQRGRVW